MKTRELRERLLVALHAVVIEEDVSNFYYLPEVATRFGFAANEGLLEAIAEEWSRQSLVKISETIGRGPDVSLTLRGIEAAEELLENHPEYQVATTLSEAVSRGTSSSGNLVGGSVLGDPVFGASQEFADMTGPSQDRLSEMVPASDRYVSVRDNQEPFDALDRPLEQILNEYWHDHKKDNFPRGDDVEAFIAEVEATRAQIRVGRVRKTQLSDELSPLLQHALLIFASYPGISEFINDALRALNYLLRTVM